MDTRESLSDSYLESFINDHRHRVVVHMVRKGGPTYDEAMDCYSDAVAKLWSRRRTIRASTPKVLGSLIGMMSWQCWIDCARRKWGQKGRPRRECVSIDSMWESQDHDAPASFDLYDRSMDLDSYVALGLALEMLDLTEGQKEVARAFMENGDANAKDAAAVCGRTVSSVKMHKIRLRKKWQEAAKTTGYV